MGLWQLQIIPGKFLLNLQHSSSEGYLRSLGFLAEQQRGCTKVKESDLWACTKSDSARGLSQRQGS